MQRARGKSDIETDLTSKAITEKKSFLVFDTKLVTSE